MLDKLCSKKAELLLQREAAKLTLNALDSKIEIIDELIEEEREKEVVVVTAEGEEIVLNTEV